MMPSASTQQCIIWRFVLIIKLKKTEAVADRTCRVVAASPGRGQVSLGSGSYKVSVVGCCLRQTVGTACVRAFAMHTCAHTYVDFE